MTGILIENIKRIAVYIRFDIKNETNLKIIKIVIDTLNDRITNEEMCDNICRFRHDIVLDRTIQNNINLDKIKAFLILSFTLLNNNIINRYYNKGYDIADMIQGVPDYEYLTSKSNLNSYYKTYVESIVEKYNFIDLKGIRLY